MDSTTTARFAVELKRRFEELAEWAIANSPNTDRPLQKSDFDLCRSEIARLAERDDLAERNARLPEPSENGPQYVNMNPTPWP